MTPRTLWAVVVVRFVVTVIVALIVMNATRGARVEHGPHTWVVQPGERMTLSADEADPGDEYICPGKDRVVGTPLPGRGVGSSGGISVDTAPDGTVTAYCEPGPPGNA